MENRFAGKVALVTGAGSGIGKQVALRFVREGAFVVAADIGREGLEDVAEEIAGLGGKVLTVQVDIAKVDGIRRMVERAVEEFGRIDMAINCAGVVQSKGFLDVTEEDWNRVIDINQKGTAFICQFVGAQMLKQLPDAVREAGKAEKSYGKIVNFSSIAGRRGRSFQVHYASSKAAVISITQSAALAFAPYGINVNAISPSVVITPMWETSITQKAKTLGTDTKTATEDMIRRIPLQRAGRPEEMASVAAFLCSEEADYITGQTINVDGGFEMN